MVTDAARIVSAPDALPLSASAFTPLTSATSLIVTPLPCSSLPVARSKRATALSVAALGPTTSPVATQASPPAPSAQASTRPAAPAAAGSVSVWVLDAAAGCSVTMPLDEPTIAKDRAPATAPVSLTVSKLFATSLPPAPVHRTTAVSVDVDGTLRSLKLAMRAKEIASPKTAPVVLHVKIVLLLTTPESTAHVTPLAFPPSGASAARPQAPAATAYMPLSVEVDPGAADVPFFTSTR